eukprot:5039208-Amphidinium_carterae.2
MMLCRSLDVWSSLSACQVSGSVAPAEAFRWQPGPIPAGQQTKDMLQRVVAEEPWVGKAAGAPEHGHWMDAAWTAPRAVTSGVGPERSKGRQFSQRERL